MSVSVALCQDLSARQPLWVVIRGWDKRSVGTGLSRMSL